MSLLGHLTPNPKTADGSYFGALLSLCVSIVMYAGKEGMKNVCRMIGKRKGSEGL